MMWPALRLGLRVYHLAMVWDYVFSVGSDTLLMGMLQLDALIGGQDTRNFPTFRNKNHKPARKGISPCARA